MGELVKRRDEVEKALSTGYLLFIALFHQIVQLLQGQLFERRLARAGRATDHGLGHGHRLDRRHLGHMADNVEFEEDFAHKRQSS